MPGLAVAADGGKNHRRRNAEQIVSRASTGVDVLDGRVAELPGWPVCGFELRPHTSADADPGPTDGRYSGSSALIGSLGSSGFQANWTKAA